MKVPKASASSAAAAAAIWPPCGKAVSVTVTSPVLDEVEAVGIGSSMTGFGWATATCSAGAACGDWPAVIQCAPARSTTAAASEATTPPEPPGNFAMLMFREGILGILPKVKTLALERMGGRAG